MDESGLTQIQSSAAPATASAIPNQSARRAVISPIGSGRPAVRRISLSDSRSHHWLSAAVPEAMSPVPTIVWISRGQLSDAVRSSPKKYPTPVLIRMSQVMRGLVSSMYSRISGRHREGIDSRTQISTHQNRQNHAGCERQGTGRDMEDREGHHQRHRLDRIDVGD